MSKPDMIPMPPAGTRLVLFNEELVEVLVGEGRVDWGQPEPEGWWVPTFYTDPRLDNMRREVEVLERELAMAMAERNVVMDVLVRFRSFVQEQDPSMIDAFAFIENNRVAGEAT